jgi:hypothetical protein
MTEVNERRNQSRDMKKKGELKPLLGIAAEQEVEEGEVP